MNTPVPTNPYKHRLFSAEIISHGVWLYYRFCLSYRDVEELLFVRSVLAALAYRQEMRHRFDTWQELTSLPTAAYS